ncbi:hypothetical protein SLS58_000406 [Diplodia intermedia]|uniref:MFS general substrate transporter n=1 Tax=Diplodia intermedia TaxID=856260 RepID=A0ABR3U6G8_9PEZI
MASFRNTEARRSQPTWIAAAEESMMTAERPDNHPEPLEMEQEMPSQIDGGKTAWIVLAASFGIFQEYYSSAPDLLGDKSSVANIGTASTGILYLSSPLTFTLLTLYPSLRRWFGPAGLVVLGGSFLASAFARRVWQLVALQGIVAGVGAGLLFAQSTLCLDERFSRRKGLAYGIMWAGKSATGVGLPFAISGGLERFGYRATMLAWTVAVTGNVLQSLGYFLPAAYLPSYATQELALPARTGALLLALLNATSVPGGILIGALCDRVHGDNAKGTRRVLLVSALPSAGAVLLFWGLAGPRGGGSDGYSTGRIMTSAVSASASISEAGATLTNNTLLAAAATATTGGRSSPSSSSVALLVVFALAYGFFAGGFSSTWGGVLRELERENPTLDTGFAFGLLAGGRGVGNVVSGPISVALIASTRARNAAAAAAAVSGGDHGQMIDGSAGGESGGGLAAAAGAYGSAYGPMILFTGISALLGAWGWLCQRPASSTFAFLDPASWRRWCQRAALLCRLAIPAPHWQQRRQRRPWSWNCVSGGAGGGGSTDDEGGAGGARGVVRAAPARQ